MSAARQPHSLQRRLFQSLVIGLPAVMLLISLLTALPIYRSVNMDDDEDLQGLATLILTSAAEQEHLEALPAFIRANRLDEGLSYTLWAANGQVIKQHSEATFNPPINGSGFVNTANPLAADAWRVWYASDPHNGNRLAIGQPWRERFDAVSDLLGAQMALLLMVSPLLLGLLFWVLRKGLQPLRVLTTSLQQRHPDDLTPIDQPVPSELQPLVQALNALLQQVGVLLKKEQRFIADASHELRSPLTAIKVQTELLSLTAHNDAQAEHLHTIQRVTDRATHLIEQLLTLAKLDPQQTLPARQTIDWLSVSENALQSTSLSAREKNIRLKRVVNVESNAVLPLQGQPTLLVLLLRNLLDNAIRYGGEGCTVTVILHSDSVTVKDNGKGIADNELPYIRQRFYRPAGQAASGSGLGLSIVERIAALHGLRFDLANHADGGVVATLHRETD